MYKQTNTFAIAVTIALLIFPLSLSSQNSFSLSLDANTATGNQSVTSVNTSAGEEVGIQVFGSNLQNVSGFGLRFEYNANQVTYQGFDTGNVLPGTPHVLPEHGTNPTTVTVGIASLGGQATVSSGLVGTIRFRTTAGFSGTDIRLSEGSVSRGRQIESRSLSARVALQVRPATPSADFDGDGTVGISDFLLFTAHFGTSRGQTGYDAQYDLDSNGSIGISDFLLFVNEFGGPPSGGGGGGGGNPDLVVDSPTVSDNTLTTGQSFTLRATVRNRGGGQAGSTTLRYYRSTNATISTSDSQVGSDGVSSLSAGGTSAESITLTAPSSSGTYYYGGCVDAVSGESDTGNNCSTGVRVTVGGGGGGGGTPSFDLDSNNDVASDITYANNRFYVLDNGDKKVYAYSSSGQRIPSADFNLSSDNNGDSYSITYANNRFYVVDLDDAKVYVYSSSGQHISSADFNLSSDNGVPDGITYANNRFYVLDNDDDKVYVYSSSGGRVSSADFNLSSDNGWPAGITYANNRFYVTDISDDKVYVYSSSGGRVSSADFNLSSDNGVPTGITYANNRFYVVDSSDDKVYVYSGGGGGGGGNRSPVAQGSIAEQRLEVGGSFGEVDVSAYFSDPDGDQLTYSARSSNTSRATVSVSGNTVTITPVSNGTATVTVTARDPGGATAQQQISVRVGGTNIVTIDDIHVSVPSDNRMIEICVYDHGRVEDNDRIRLSVNGVIVHDGALFFQARCFDVAVNEGANELVVLALNEGTSPPNTAAIRVRGINEVTETWALNANTGSRSQIIVTIGSSGGGGGGDDHGNNRSMATQVLPNSTTNGQISPARDNDYFRVEVSGSGTLTVETSGSTDTVGELQDSSGNAIASDDDSGSNANFRISRSVSSGTYYINVRGYGSTTGSYTLSVSFSGGGGGGGDGFDLDSDNGGASDITYANNRFYVTDYTDDKVYVYSSSGGRVSSADFNLSSDNDRAWGITYANNRFYVTDYTDDKVYVYSSSGGRVSSSDFDLSSDNAHPTGITYANNRFYVVDYSDDKVYVYSSSGGRVSSADFDLSSDNGNPYSITYANNRFYVVDLDDAKVYVYSGSGQHIPSADFNLSSDNGAATGITYANNRFYVVDYSDDKVYVYSSSGQ